MVRYRLISTNDVVPRMLSSGTDAASEHQVELLRFRDFIIGIRVLD